MPIRALNGRLVRVSSFQNKLCLVVGFVGNVWPHDLTQEQRQYIRGLYHIPVTWTSTITNQPTDCILPVNNFNGFIEFAPSKGGSANG